MANAKHQETAADRERYWLLVRALDDRGLRMVDVAHRCRVGLSMVSQVVSGFKRSRKVEIALAKIAGVPHAELWPKKEAHETHEKTRKAGVGA